MIDALKYYVTAEDAQFQKELYKSDFLSFISNLVTFDKVLKTLKERTKLLMDFRKSNFTDLASKGYQILESQLEKLNSELKSLSISLSNNAKIWFHTSAMGYLLNCLID